MSNQIVISSGAKVRDLNGVLTGTSGIVSSVPLGAANGVATLDSGGKVPVSQLPSSVVTYLGTWNAATNTPTLVNGTGDAGDMYICNVAGTVNFGAGPVTFAVGDWVLYGSGTWQKSNGQNGTVTSVAVTESGDALTITGSPITTSGTINIGFAGTSGQYVNGAGGLTTFPSLTGFVPYTGATANVDLGGNSLYFNNGQAIFGRNFTGTTAYALIGVNPSNKVSIDTSALGAVFGGDVTGISYIANGLGSQAGTIALKQNGLMSAGTGYATLGSLSAGQLVIYFGDSNLYAATFLNTSLTDSRSYTLPNASGTIALTSNLSSYVPYSGATANVNLGIYGLLAQAIVVGQTSTQGYIHFKTGGSTAISADTCQAPYGTNGMIYSFDQTGGNYKQFVIDSSLLTNNTIRTYSMPDASGTLALTSDIPSLTGYVPYTGASANLNLGTFDLTADVITGATGSFASSGGSNTFAINHSSGSGIALNITKGGNGEGLYINKTSGSGNAATIIGTLNATTLVKSGGTSSQFLKADGSVDSNSYVTIDTTQTISGAKTFSTTLTVNNTITTSSTSLILQQTGDVYGTTQLLLLNRDGSNGAIFKNLGLDLVDFGFVTSSTAQGNVRFEKRAGNRLTDNTTGEFQFVINASSGFAYFQSGFFATSISQGNLLVGTTTNASYKLDVVGTARVSGLITANGGLQMEGQALAFNQSGVRSWNIQATGGNLRFQSGDNAGSTTFTMPINGTSASFSSTLGITGALSGTSGNFIIDDSATNSVLDILTLTHTTTGTAASGLGAGILFRAERPDGITLSRGAIYGVSGADAYDDGDLAFYTLTSTAGGGFNEKVRINSAGNLGIGTNVPPNKLTVQSDDTFNQDNSGQIVIRGTSNTSKVLRIGFDTTNNYGYLQAIEVGSTTRSIVLQPFGGNVLLATTSDFGQEAVPMLAISVKNSTSKWGINMQSDASGAYRAITFYNSAGTSQGFISVNGSGTTTYSTTASDLRLKQNINDWNENITSIFKNIKPKTFEFIGYDNPNTEKGFIAQDMVDNFPEAYPIDEKGYYSFNPSGMVVYLMKAIKEQQAQIEELKLKIK